MTNRFSKSDSGTFLLDPEDRALFKAAFVPGFILGGTQRGHSFTGL